MIIRHDRSDKDSLVNTNHWPGITSFFRGSGAASLIAPTWLLTAAHVARRIPTDPRLSVELAGKRYLIERVLLHPDYRSEWEQEDEDNGADTIDLAVVKLETPVEDIVPFGLYEHSDEQGQEVLLLGQGSCGNGLRGMMQGTDRQLRRVTNRIDEVDGYWIKFRFDAPPDGTLLEGVCGAGDSGGPALIYSGDQLLLAGVSSWQHHGSSPLGTYGCIEHYTRVSCFVDWIQASCGLQSRAS